MSSTLVHLAIGGLVATALLGRTFDRRTLAIVLVAAVLPDLDSLTALVLPGTHRALLHTLLLPALLLAVLAADCSRGADSLVRGRWGARGVRTGWVAAAAVLVAGIAPDLVTNGANLFYPLHDQFYILDGKLRLSTTEGVVQTFVDRSADTGDPGGSAAVGSTDETFYATPVDMQRGDDAADVERIVPIVDSGWELALLAFGTFATAVRLRDAGRR